MIPRRAFIPAGSAAMRAVNIYSLTRTQDPGSMSMLFRVLSMCEGKKQISPHEAGSLRCLADLAFRDLMAGSGEGEDSLSYLDGFFFSYVIDHIGKEFDLLKISSDGECVLNIELKSEDIGEDRIRKQLEQNRYYLSHTAHTIFSFTYVMSTDTLYCLNDRGYMSQCPAGHLTRVLRHPALQDYLKEQIDRFFRSADYLISPVATPEKFLRRQYFLTNQQAEFRRKILDHLKEEERPVVAVTGIAGTGKTLLLFDLALKLSRRNRILFIHVGLLRKGHYILDNRLRNVDIRSTDEIGQPPDLAAYSGLILDEAGYLSRECLDAYIEAAGKARIPLVMSYDPHQLLNDLPGEAQEAETVSRIEEACTLRLAFSGNIRINRPVYSFLRTLLHLRDHPGQPDYSCIEVLCAKDGEECRILARHYTEAGYKLLRQGLISTVQNQVIAQEYDRVVVVLDESYYYDGALRLCVRGGSDTPIRLLYEGLSRTREKLCLIVKGNPELFSRILEARLNRSI